MLLVSKERDGFVWRSRSADWSWLVKLRWSSKDWTNLKHPTSWPIFLAEKNNNDDAHYSCLSCSLKQRSERSKSAQKRKQFAQKSKNGRHFFVSRYFQSVRFALFVAFWRGIFWASFFSAARDILLIFWSQWTKSEELSWKNVCFSWAASPIGTKTQILSHPK